MQNIDTLKMNELEKLVGNLSHTSKMPCPSFSLSANDCKIGSQLRQVKGSVCQNCYGCKGCYQFPVHKQASKNRLKALDNLPLFVRVISTIIKRKKLTSFRWHDVGDLQSLEHLQAICAIAALCPSCSFWLPTKERAIVKEYLSSGKVIPENLCIRISMPMIGQEAIDFQGLPIATVGCDTKQEYFQCPVSSSKEGCKTHNCSVCWNKKVKVVNYRSH